MQIGYHRAGGIARTQLMPGHTTFVKTCAQSLGPCFPAKFLNFRASQASSEAILGLTVVLSQEYARPTKPLVWIRNVNHSNTTYS